MIKDFDPMKTYPTKRISIEEVHRLIDHYGMIYDAMSSSVKELCGLDFITKKYYIIRSLKRYHHISLG